LLADVYGSLGISGKEAETLLDHVGMTLNMNSIADDTRKPMDPSGIRFGTPAITTRGFNEKDCAYIAELMVDTLKNKDNTKRLKAIREEVRKISKKHPVPNTMV
jgi:glycine hydroxymethyltransferase